MIDKETPIRDIWGMIKKMRGVRWEGKYPVLSSGTEPAVTNIDKADLMARTFVKVHSSNNLSAEARRIRENTMTSNM